MTNIAEEIIALIKKDQKAVQADYDFMVTQEVVNPFCPATIEHVRSYAEAMGRLLEQLEQAEKVEIQ